MITVQNEDRQAGPGRGAGRWPGMYRGASLDSATRLCNCIFTTDTLELDQESAPDFCLKK